MVGAKRDRVGIDSVKLRSEHVTVHIFFTMASIICIEISNLFLSEFNKIIFHFIEKWPSKKKKKNSYFTFEKS